MAPRNRKVLTLAKRVKVIEKFEKGKSARAIAVECGVGKTQIRNVFGTPCRGP